MKCVKSVLGDFSSGVSVCHNKSTQSDLEAPFLPGPHSRGALPPALRRGLGQMRLTLTFNTVSCGLQLRAANNRISTVTSQRMLCNVTCVVQTGLVALHHGCQVTIVTFCITIVTLCITIVTLCITIVTLSVYCCMASYFQTASYNKSTYLTSEKRFLFLIQPWGMTSNAWHLPFPNNDLWWFALTQCMLTHYEFHVSKTLTTSLERSQFFMNIIWKCFSISFLKI